MLKEVVFLVSVCIAFSDRAQETLEEFNLAVEMSRSNNLEEFREGLELLMGKEYGRMDLFKSSSLEASEIYSRFSESLKNSVKDCLFDRRRTSHIKRCFKYNAIMNEKELKHKGASDYRHLDYFSDEALSKFLPAVIKNEFFYENMMAQASDNNDLYQEDQDKHVQIIISYFLRVLKKLRITSSGEGVSFSRLGKELVELYNSSKAAPLEGCRSIEQILEDIQQAAYGISKISKSDVSSRMKAYSSFVAVSDKRLSELVVLEKKATSSIPAEKKFALFRFKTVFDLMINTIRLYCAVIDGCSELSGRPVLGVVDMPDRLLDYASSLFLYSMYECADPATLRHRISNCINKTDPVMSQIAEGIEKDNRRFRECLYFEIKDDEVYSAMQKSVYVNEDTRSSWIPGIFYDVYDSVVGRKDDGKASKEMEDEKTQARRFLLEKEDSYSTDGQYPDGEDTSYERAMKMHYSNLFNRKMKEKSRKRVEDLVIDFYLFVPAEKVDLLKTYLDLVYKLGSIPNRKELERLVCGATVSSLSSNRDVLEAMLGSLDLLEVSQWMFLEPILRVVFEFFGVQNYNLCNPSFEELKNTLEQIRDVVALGGGMGKLQVQYNFLMLLCLMAFACVGVLGFKLHRREKENGQK